MLNVYRSNRMERLVDALTEVLREPLSDPAEPEWIAVQSQGMRAWLGQQLADRFDVFANVRLPFPRELVDRVCSWVLGEQAPETEPFDQTCLAWSILAELPSLLERPGFEPVRAYLGDERRGFKLHQLVRSIAHTFDEYALFRPEMVLGWERQPLRDDWQAVLWNAAGGRIRELGEAEHVGEIARRTAEAIGAGQHLDRGAPERVALFGITSLPPLYVRILARFAKRAEVHLFLLSPSRHYWADIARQVPRGVELDDIEEMHHDPGHPLLASMGRLDRDFQAVLESRADYRDFDRDLYEDPLAGERSSLLATLQSDILELRARGCSADAPRVGLESSDRSIQVHSCHGPMREVEVLKDQLFALFDDDDLELCPEDVLVATPDIERFTPLVDAVFGRDIPRSISGRGARREAPVVDGLLALLEMVGGRAEASTVLDFVAREPVLARAGLTETDLELVTRWSIEAGARWGVDAEHRSRLDQPGFPENTWRFTIDRLLLGYAMPGRDKEMFRGVLPFDNVEGSAAETIGRFVALVELLLDRVVDFERPRSLRAWAADLRDLIGRLFDDRGPLAEQHAALHAALTDIESSAERAGFRGEVDASIVRAEIEERLDDSARGSSRLAGGVRVAGMLPRFPLRGIPFRVVCLLGLSEGSLPRPNHAPGFDEMARRPRVGDRSPRDDDRGQFLDALLSARDRLIITYTGQDPHTNAPLPPSVLVSELLDVVAEGFAAAVDQSRPTGSQLTVRHPLQPFSRRYFELGPRRDERLFSYRDEHLECARDTGRRVERATFVSPGSRLPLDPEEIGTVRLVDLERFFKSPAAYFLDRRLGVRFGEGEAEVDDREPFEIAGLDLYEAGEQLLAEALGGGDVQSHYPLLRAAGVLPLGTPGRRAFDSLTAQVDLFRDELGEVAGAHLDPLELAVDVRTPYGATRVVGALRGLTEAAHVRVSFGRKYAFRLLKLWLGHLALGCASRPGLPRSTVWIGRTKDGVERVDFKPVDGDPQALLADLVELYWAGQEAPLPLMPASSLAFAYKMTSPHRKKKETPEDVERQALKNAWSKWDPEAFRGVREGADPAVARVFGEASPLDAVAADGPLGFKSVALRAFGPLLAQLERFTMGRC